MLIAAASMMSSRRTSARGHACARRDWANYAGQGTVVGIKREPQPTTIHEGKAPDA